MAVQDKQHKYNMGFRVSNSLVWTYFEDLVVGDNETVTITYEYVSDLVEYQWTLTQ